jgi:hypothetical protein
MLKRFNVHHEFFKNNVKPYYFVKDTDGFNLSMLKYRDNLYICCVRMAALVPAFFGEPLEPGSCSGQELYMKQRVDISTIKIGKNFIWNNWISFHIDSTVFFVVRLVGGNFMVAEEIEPACIQNVPITYKGEKTNFSYSDVRFFRNSTQMFMYDGYISTIYEIQINDNKIESLLFGNVSSNMFVKKNFCNEIRNFDKNWAYMQNKSTGGINYMIFLNWFEKGNVTISKVPMSVSNDNCLKETIIEMEGDAIDGLDSGMTNGMFSFGVPFLVLKPDFEGISVGHIKIPFSNKKNYNPNLLTFLDEVEKIEKKHSNFIRHNSYDYLMFYIYFKKETTYEMRISNAFLIVDTKEKYMFSINYPMSIVSTGSGDAVTIAMGCGDFYNYIYNTTTRDIISLCVHDVKKMSFEKFTYDILLL